MLEPRQFDLSPLRRAPEGSATTVADACGRVRGVREGRRTATQGFLVDVYRQHGRDRGRFRSARSGPEVQRLPAVDLADEIEQVAGLLRAWIAEVQENGGDPSTIGLLTRWNKTRDVLVRALDDRGLKVASVDRNVSHRRGAPLVMTYHRAKGAEFTHVVLFGVDASSALDTERGGYDKQTREALELQERSLPYVGATRARDRLAVAWARESARLLKDSLG